MFNKAVGVTDETTAFAWEMVSDLAALTFIPPSDDLLSQKLNSPALWVSQGEALVSGSVYCWFQ